MNAVSRTSIHQADWVINYLEVNSRPSPSSEFRRLRITSKEIQIDPAGIVLSVGKSRDQGIELHSGSSNYLGTIVQRGNELVVNLHRENCSDRLVIVAKRSVSEFDPSVTFRQNSHLPMPENVAPAPNIELRSFF